MTATRWYGSLSATEITSRMAEESIVCLPIGSYEQHGPHLPLHTDTVIAEKFTPGWSAATATSTIYGTAPASHSACHSNTHGHPARSRYGPVS